MRRLLIAMMLTAFPVCFAEDAPQYLSYADLQGKLRQLQANHPQWVTMQRIGSSIQDRPIYAMRITEPAQGEKNNRPRILITAGVHAREQQSVHFAMRFLADLADHRAQFPALQHLLSQREIWIVPCVNPDGRVYDLPVGEKPRNWRKNRRRNADGSFGVDLNRNSSHRWGGADAAGDSPLFEGTHPFSEPETLALRRFIDAKRFVVWLDLHSAGGALFTPRFLTEQESHYFALLRQAFFTAQKNPYTDLPPGREIQPAHAQPPVHRSANTGLLWQWGYYTRGIFTGLLEIRRDPSQSIDDLHYPTVAFMDAEYEANGRDAMAAFALLGGELPPAMDATPFGGPQIRLQHVRIDDDANGASDGNSNGIPDPGETIELHVSLRNDGDRDARNLWATLFSDDPHVQILMELRTDGADLAPRNESPAMRFVFRVREDTPLSETLYFTMQVMDHDRRRWSIPLRVDRASTLQLAE